MRRNRLDGDTFPVERAPVEGEAPTPEESINAPEMATTCRHCEGTRAGDDPSLCSACGRCLCCGHAPSCEVRVEAERIAKAEAEGETEQQP